MPKAGYNNNYSWLKSCWGWWKILHSSYLIIIKDIFDYNKNSSRVLYVRPSKQTDCTVLPDSCFIAEKDGNLIPERIIQGNYMLSLAVDNWLLTYKSL